MAHPRLIRRALLLGAVAALIAVALAVLTPPVAGFLAVPRNRQLAAETLKLATACTGLCLILGAPLAWALRLWGERLGFRAGPLLRVLARVTGLLVVLGEFGLVNLVLRTLRLETEVARDRVLGELTVLAGMVQVFAPFMVLALVRAMAQVEIGTVRAWRSLGASHATVFWRLALPKSLPGVAVGLATVFALAAGATVTVSVMGSRQVRALAGLAFDEGAELVVWQVAAVAVVVAAAGLLVAGRRLLQRAPNSRAAAPSTRSR